MHHVQCLHPCMHHSFPTSAPAQKNTCAYACAHPRARARARSHGSAFKRSATSAVVMWPESLMAVGAFVMHHVRSLHPCMHSQHQRQQNHLYMCARARARACPPMMRHGSAFKRSATSAVVLWLESSGWNSPNTSRHVLGNKHHVCFTYSSLRAP